MKTKSRKRLLISSVAMLLVAMLALGTATFAWFTQNTSATADGITVRTSKTSSLKISDDNREYGSGFTYIGVQNIMLPSSSIDGAHWYSTVADDASGVSTKTPTAITLDTPEQMNKNNKYVFVDQLNIQNAGEVAVKDIKITMSNFNAHNYLRVALVPVTAKGQCIEVDATKFRSNVYAADGIAYNPIKADGAYSEEEADQITPIVAGSPEVINIPDSLAAGKELHYNLYVWFEGQDPDCKDINAGTGVKDLKFTVEGTPVSEA